MTAAVTDIVDLGLEPKPGVLDGVRVIELADEQAGKVNIAFVAVGEKATRNAFDFKLDYIKLVSNVETMRQTMLRVDMCAPRKIFTNASAEGFEETGLRLPFGVRVIVLKLLSYATIKCFVVNVFDVTVDTSPVNSSVSLC